MRFGLKVPTGRLVVDTTSKWVGVSKDIGSSWTTEKELDKVIKTLSNDAQFKKSEFFKLFQTATKEMI